MHCKETLLLRFPATASRLKCCDIFSNLLFLPPSFPRRQEPLSPGRGLRPLSGDGEALLLWKLESGVQAFLLRRLLRQRQQLQEHGGVPGKVSQPRWGHMLTFLKGEAGEHPGCRGSRTVLSILFKPTYTISRALVLSHCEHSEDCQRLLQLDWAYKYNKCVIFPTLYDRKHINTSASWIIIKVPFFTWSL